MSRIFERTTMTLRHIVICDNCNETRPLLPASSRWFLPWHWRDLGDGHHLCPRPDCLADWADRMKQKETQTA